MDFCPENVLQGKIRATVNFEIADVGKKTRSQDGCFSLLILKFCKYVDEGMVPFF